MITVVALPLLALWAGASGAEPLAKPGDGGLRIERGVVYNDAPFLSAEGGTAPYTFRVDASTLPPGLTLSPAGRLSGLTCDSAGTFALGTVTVMDAAGDSNSESANQLIVGPAPAGACALAVASNGPPAVVGQPYQATLAVNGGSAPYSFVVVSGALPAGLALSSSGVLAGTPTASASQRFIVLARDAAGATGVLNTTMTVAEITLSPPTLASGTTGAAYSQTLAANGGSAPYTYAVTAGSLPPGLSLSRSGKLTGTPIAVGKARFTVTALDAGRASSTRSYTVRIGATPYPTASSHFNATGAALAFTPLSAQGGSALHNFATTPTANAALPARTVRPLDTRGAAAARDLGASAVAPAPLDLQPRVLALPQAGVLFSTPLTVSGGVAPYRFEVLQGSLPEGLVLDADSGVIWGRARHGGSEQVRLLVTDAAGDTLSVDVALSVGARADANADAVVAGLQSGEAEALKRLSAAQMRNVLARLDGDIDCRPEWQQQIHLNTTWRDARPAGVTEAGAPQQADKPGCTRGLSAWAAGTVDYGRVAGSLGSAGSRFSTPGLSAGVDLAPLRGVRSGIALGHGQDRSDIGGGAGAVDSRSESVTAYGSWQAPLFGVRLNAALGQARTTLDRQRSVTGDSLSVQGQRRVTQRYGAVAGSTRFDVGDWRVSPRMGVEHMRAALDGYTESGASPLALGYDAAQLASSDVRGGLAVTRQWRPALWTVEPEFSLDWHKRLQGGVTQTLRYADDPLGGSYTLASAEPAAEFTQVGLGVRVSHPLGWSLSVGARSTLDGGALRSGGYSAAVRWPF